MINKIEINFPINIELSDTFRRSLLLLIDEECKRYEFHNPGRVMWPAGNGQKIIWNEPYEPTFDESVYVIDIAEKENNIL